MNKVILEDGSSIFTVEQLIDFLPRKTAFVGTSPDGLKGLFLITYQGIIFANSFIYAWVDKEVQFKVDRFVDLEITVEEIE